MGQAIERNDIEGVLDWYDMNGMPYFSVWDGRNIKFQCVDADMARGILEDNLKALAASKTANVYTLKMHPEPGKSGYITNASPVSGTLNFRLSEPLPRHAMGSAPMALQSGYAESRYIDKLEREIDDLKEKVAELEEVIAEYKENEGDDAKLGIIGTIGKAATEYPVLGESINKIVGIMANIFQPRQQMMPAINGVGELQHYAPAPATPTSTTVHMTPPTEQELTQQLVQVLDRLEKYFISQFGADGQQKLVHYLGKLAQLAETNPTFLNLMLKQLDAL
jgi:hypothetical protein